MYTKQNTENDEAIQEKGKTLCNSCSTIGLLINGNFDDDGFNDYNGVEDDDEDGDDDDDKDEEMTPVKDG